jgi:diaminopimelate decarboxylase
MIRPSEPAAIGRILAQALTAGIFPDDHAALVVYDLALLRERAVSIRRAFPAGTLNTAAVKANPLPGVLREVQELGMGAEVASRPEMELALRSGFRPEIIVYDSPVKRYDEIGEALRLGVRLNADSFGELSRIGQVLAGSLPHQPIGLRVNPQVGHGEIPDTATAGTASKFGVPLKGTGEEIGLAFERFPWLTGLHVHIGSQGCPPHLMAEGVRQTAEFAEALRSSLRRRGIAGRPAIIDIGGGLPVPYHSGEQRPGVEEYRKLLDEVCPQLFSFDIVTEFGRYLHANAGWAASRVEYVKRSGPSTFVLIHLGADMFPRRVYRPDFWFHEISVFTATGERKEGMKEPVTVAGPLCFSGDVLARDVPLPRIEEGDIVIVHDAGAYTLGMWSRYNSRQMPRVAAYHGSEQGFSILKEREQPDDLWRFWT